MSQCFQVETRDYLWNAGSMGDVVYEGCDAHGWKEDTICDDYKKRGENSP